MRHFGTYVQDLKIAYIGGGSRDWAWKLMADLAACKVLEGTVYLYDIDFNAAKDNEIIGGKSGGNFKYKAVETVKEALTGANIVIISILPGTFDEMESDVHEPEKYGIYQSVGDTTGPGGIIRALRTIPMFIEIAEAIKSYCPQAWVINYTNPMAICVATLYKVFPQIKAFGCCHEVFGTQNTLCKVLQEFGIAEGVKRHDLVTKPMGLNHFTWVTEARYQNTDLMPYYAKYIDKILEKRDEPDFTCREMLKYELFKTFGYIAAAGSRHIAEFCPSSWFLKSEETVKSWHFVLTPVSERKEKLKAKLEESRQLINGEKEFDGTVSKEEGVNQICALLGLKRFITNVNLPNVGQISNVPLGVVVETNAYFSGDNVEPQVAGKMPENILSLTMPAICGQINVMNGFFEQDINLIFNAFATDRLVDCIPISDAKKLFNTMIDNTKHYLPEWIKEI